MMQISLSGALLSLLVFLTQPARAQQHTFRYYNDVKVIIDSDTLKHPWVGGLNSPVFSRIDLNQDGTEDLFVFDRTHQKSYTFLARREQGTWQWHYEPAYEYLFPTDLEGWVLLRDYDRDGRRDIFTKTSLGIKVYRNTTAPGKALSFVEAVSFLVFDSQINLQASSENLPAIMDMDQDGDLDVLLFNFATSSAIEYYKNLQQEENLPASQFRYTRASSYWGGLNRCHSHDCHAYVFNAACRTDGTTHNAGTTLLALDLDGDGDQDILTGEESCPELVRITNSGTREEGLLRREGMQVGFPGTAPAAGMAFPAAYYEDLNFDQVPDLLVAPFARSNSNNNIDFSRSSWYYQHTGSGFEFRQKNFLQEHMVDAGEGSAPALADVDADGDVDLLLGTRTGSIWFFRNTGTSAKAVFQLESRDYQGLSAAGLRELRPLLTDLNGDGRLDLVLSGTTAGSSSLSYIANAAPLGQPARFPADRRQTLLTPGGAPAFYDLDGDGDKDLVLASAQPRTLESGTLQLYRNTGSSTSPVFSLENDNWGGIAREYYRRNAFPLLADLNRDHEPELLLADDTGELRVYSHLGANQQNTFSPVKDVFSYPGAQAHGPLRLGGSLTLAAADLDGDQVPEVMAGSQGGGLVLLKQESANTAPLPVTRFSLFPNPAGTWVRLWSEEPVRVVLWNTAGQQLKVFGNTFRQTHELDVSDLPAGLYLVQVCTAGGKQSTHRLVINRQGR